MPLICQSRWWLLNDRHCMAETASQRAVSVQSQGPSQFNSLSVSLLPHFKRWHIKGLLLLDCIHLYTHKFDHTHWTIYTQHTGNIRKVTNSVLTPVDVHTHRNAQYTYYNAAFWAGCVGRWHCLTLSHLLSALPALLWDTARCTERESKREKEREGKRERKQKEDEVVPNGNTPGLGGSE